jgi:hypothetical protein
MQKQAPPVLINMIIQSHFSNVKSKKIIRKNKTLK